MNTRPPGYEPGELPNCSTPQKSLYTIVYRCQVIFVKLCRVPGSRTQFSVVLETARLSVGCTHHFREVYHPPCSSSDSNREPSGFEPDASTSWARRAMRRTSLRGSLTRLLQDVNSVGRNYCDSGQLRAQRDVLCHHASILFGQPSILRLEVHLVMLLRRSESVHEGMLLRPDERLLGLKEPTPQSVLTLTRRRPESGHFSSPAYGVASREDSDHTRRRRS